MAFLLVMALYIVAETNRTLPIDWKVTLSKDDKNPFGGYILYRQLTDLFPAAHISSYRLPVYNQLNKHSRLNTAYLLIGDKLHLKSEDVRELLKYVRSGNYAFLAGSEFSSLLMDSLKLKTGRRFSLRNSDSSRINLKNPALHAVIDYGFKRMTIDGYFRELDTLKAVVLGNNHFNDVNFVKMAYGKGAFLVHTLPLSFSNYFLLTRQNADYTAKALSYLPANIRRVYWDEYYKLGPAGSSNPLRFILGNTWLKWAFRTGLAAMIMFLVFGMKRRQRIIPVIQPLRNSTLDFVQTVGKVYFNQRDNKNIALKRINYFLERVRSNFFLSTSHLNHEFVESLAEKSGAGKQEVSDLVNAINEIYDLATVSDEAILRLNKKIDYFNGRIGYDGRSAATQPVLIQ